MHTFYSIPQLRDWRLSRGLTLDELGKAARVSVSCLSRVERGLSTVDARRFSSIVVAISALDDRGHGIAPPTDGLVARLAEMAGA